MDEKEAALSDVAELIPRLQRAIHRSPIVQEKQRSWKATTNLTMAQLRALMTLDDNEQLTVGQLAEHLGTGMPAASSIVDRLVEEGLAERRQDPDDRRRIVVRPSREGSERIEMMRQGPKEVVQALLLRLTASELQHLVKGLRAFTRAAEEMQDSPESKSPAAARKQSDTAPLLVDIPDQLSSKEVHA